MVVPDEIYSLAVVLCEVATRMPAFLAISLVIYLFIPIEEASIPE